MIKIKSGFCAKFFFLLFFFLVCCFYSFPLQAQKQLQTKVSAIADTDSVDESLFLLTDETEPPEEDDFNFLDSHNTIATTPAFIATDPYELSLRLLSSLAIIIALLFGVAWFFQKKSGLGNNIYGKVLGVLPIDNKKYLYIVDIMGKVLILGATEFNISMLCEITDENTINTLRLDNSSPPIPGMEKIFSFLKRAPKVDEVPSSLDELPIEDIPVDVHTQKNKERLKKINRLLLKREKSDQK